MIDEEIRAEIARQVKKAVTLAGTGRTQKTAAAIAHAPIRQQKVFNWSQLDAGDCHQINGTLTFYSDGTGSWSCTTWTDHTHSGDTWRTSFNVQTAAGAGLFNLGEFDSPRMDDGNPPPRYGWSNAFSFNSDQFDAIGLVTQNYSC